jgi:hypothetical protein
LILLIFIDSSTLLCNCLRKPGGRLGDQIK